MAINCSQYYSQLCWFEDVNYTAWIQCSVYIYIISYIYIYIYIIDKNTILVSFVIDHPSTLASMSVVQVCGLWILGRYHNEDMGYIQWESQSRSRDFRSCGWISTAFSQNDGLKREGFSQLNTLFICYRVSMGFS